MNHIDRYNEWLKYDFLDKDTKAELLAMEGDEGKIKESFIGFVPFGTAGMRGEMGVGTNKINIYTIRRATQGFSDFINENKNDNKSVAIIYDSRINSKKFALETALTFCANGIKVYTFKSLRPTPFLSFVIRKLGLVGGVNITASHNSKEYNGYKLYLSDGSQFSYPDDEKIINYVNNINDLSNCKTMTEKEAIKKGLLKYIDGKIDEEFKKCAEEKFINKDMVKKYGKELKVIYTPLHGTGSVFLKDAFKEVGFTNVKIVKSQDDKNGEFKTVTYPNPESKAAFDEALKLARENDADIVVATDPDADRLGVYVKTNKNEYVPLTGNELASIICEYIMFFAKKNKVDFDNSYAVKSFVTTRMMDAICERYGVDLKVTLTGFKWIGKEILNNKKHFIFGCEESYGFLVSDYVRDKDAISATLLTLEMALAFKKYVGNNLIDVLNMMKEYYGVYKNYNKNLDFAGVDGIEKMKTLMDSLRNNPINQLTDIKVTKIDDYLTSTSLDLSTNITTQLLLPSNNTIVMHLEDNSVVTIRPSGTEPKIKIYFDILDTEEDLADNKYEILQQAITKIFNFGGF